MEFDFACNRASFFGEQYVHGVVNEILWANADPTRVKVFPGFPHTALQTKRMKGGRSREVDFYIRPHNRDEPGEVCIEVKWAGSSHCTGVNVLADLCRLTLVAQAGDATCFFVLAGRAADVEALMNSSKIAVENGAEKSRVIKRPGSIRDAKIAKVALSPHLASGKAIPKFVKSLPRVPKEITSKIVTPYKSPGSRWAVLIWRVFP